MSSNAEGCFGGIRYAGTEHLSPEERRDYRRALSRYVKAQASHPAYQRPDGNEALQALSIERDLHALVRGRVLSALPKPEPLEEAQGALYAVQHLKSPKAALNLVLQRAISRSITRVLNAAPDLVPLVVAVLAAKEVLSALNEHALSEQEKAQQWEDEHRHDREQQFLSENRHDYERER